jgi:predicted DNA-binding transcriptional regulator AlpA
MNIESTAGVASGPKTHGVAVTISPWVNEPLPNIHGILSARDLARLTRRSRWVLCGLALIGKFPRKKRYRGRLVGWCRAEILEWMTRDLSIETENRERLDGPRRCLSQHPRQRRLPLDCPEPYMATRTNAQKRERNR